MRRAARPSWLLSHAGAFLLGVMCSVTLAYVLVAAPHDAGAAQLQRRPAPSRGRESDVLAAARASQQAPAAGARLAYVTLVATDDYVESARVFAYSLRAAGYGDTRHAVAVMVTSGVSPAGRAQLSHSFDSVIAVDSIANPTPGEKMLRANFANTYTKLATWTLHAHFDRVVFLDADCLVLQNIDELFNYREFAAVEDCMGDFNSAVFVCEPNADTFADMMRRVPEIKSMDGGDQGFLIEYFPKWTKLDFVYNALQTHLVAVWNHPAWNARKDEIKVLHYMAFKPWSDTPPPRELEELRALWRRVRDEAGLVRAVEP